MNKATGIANIQNVPGDTDFEDRPRSEEERVREKDNRQMPPDKNAFITPISDPLFEKDKPAINDPTPAPRAIMSRYSNREQRIF